MEDSHLPDWIWLGPVTYTPFQSQANSEFGRYPPKATMAANARLIAAAPELVEALRALFGFWDAHKDEDDENTLTEPFAMWDKKTRALLARIEKGDP